MTLALILAVLAAPDSLTLQEAAALAAAGAPGVERARAETELARAAQSSAKAALGPTLFSDFGFLSSNNPVTVFSLALEQQRFSAEEFFASDPNDPPFTKDWSAAVAAAWTVDIFGSTRAAAKAAGSAAEAAERAAKRTGDGAALSAIAAFVEARRAEDTLAILAERQADAERDEALARSLHEQGLSTSADPARALAVVAQIRAESAGVSASAAAARAALAALIGAPDAARPLASLPEVATVDLEAPASTRDDVAAADLAAEAARQSARSADNARWPSLVVTGRYELHAPTIDGRYGDSATVFGGFRVPIFASGAISARVAAARAQARAAEAAAAERRRTAESEVAAARAHARAAEARIGAFAEAETAARRARDIQQARYEEGAARLSDLLEARSAELAARVGAVAAAADRVLAEANLRMALGLPPEGVAP